MPTWSDILREVNAVPQAERPQKIQTVRRQYLNQYKQLTGREVIVYATAFTQQRGDNPGQLSINDEDIHGLMEVTYGLQTQELDLFLHSPGGSIEAADAFVDYIRKRFTNVRAVVPQIAMSAATMIACACDKIVMAKHSSLGPTDPQLTVFTNGGVRQAAAQSILDQFETAMKDCRENPGNATAWNPILGQYAPDLVEAAKNALSLSTELVRDNLAKYMFSGEADAMEKASRIADDLRRQSLHRSHGRHLSREKVEALGLKVEHLESDQAWQDAALSVFHCFMLTFTGTPISKIIENAEGRTFAKLAPTR